LLDKTAPAVPGSVKEPAKKPSTPTFNLPPAPPTPTDLGKALPTSGRTPDSLPPADLLPPSPVPLTREKEK
jgi:hypothetical protein